jgi:glycosyltransferase XagB
MDDAEAKVRLQASISGLAERVPLVSARALFSTGQRALLLSCLGVISIGFLLAPLTTLRVLVGVVSALYITLVTYRFRLFLRSTREGTVVRVSDDEACGIPEGMLPSYTLLIPAYRESEVIANLLRNVARLEYPVDRLQVLLLVEADDQQTIEAVVNADPGPQFELVLIPPSEPRTKPKALNFGLSLATGQLIAVYDAEDIPEPLQLRRAAIGLAKLGGTFGCLQSKLSYHNPTQNMITKWFAIEYAMWFSFFLPGLAAMRAPIPLGGTSNHFRRSSLRSMGAWDPFNVTEDADLGVRMAREGYAIGVLESTTLEEANSDFVNWVRQRSRWYKGYLQTFIVHSRSPRKFLRETGWRATAHFGLFVGGTPTLALLSPLFWLMTFLWFFGQPSFIESLFPGPLYYIGLLSLTLGNFLLFYLTLISSRLVQRTDLLVATLLIPLYWLMMSMAAVKAAWQLVTQPAHWEKTFHGLDGARPATNSVPGSAA